MFKPSLFFYALAVSIATSNSAQPAAQATAQSAAQVVARAARTATLALRKQPVLAAAGAGVMGVSLAVQRGAPQLLWKANEVLEKVEKIGDPENTLEALETEVLKLTQRIGGDHDYTDSDKTIGQRLKALETEAAKPTPKAKNISLDDTIDSNNQPNTHAHETFEKRLGALEKQVEGLRDIIFSAPIKIGVFRENEQLLDLAQRVASLEDSRNAMLAAAAVRSVPVAISYLPYGHSDLQAGGVKLYGSLPRPPKQANGRRQRNGTAGPNTLTAALAPYQSNRAAAGAGTGNGADHKAKK